MNLYCGISGFSVKTIPIERNMFKYSVSSPLTSTPLHAIGIDGVDFSFIAQTNQFYNTNLGIYMRTVGGASSVNINDNLFNNNWRAVYMRGIQQPKITNNKINDVINALDAFGILQETGSGYNISWNHLLGTNPFLNFSIGMSFKNTGKDYNTCRHNTIYNFKYGSQSEGNNRNGNDPNQGLKFLCNDIQKGIFDISQIPTFALGYPVNQNTGMSLHQGISSSFRTAGNTFSRSGITNHLDVYDQFGQTILPLTYYYCCAPINNFNPEHPYFISGGVNPNSPGWLTDCGSLYKQNYLYPEDGDMIYEQIQHYNSLGNEYRDSLYYWVDKWSTAEGKLYKSDLLMADSNFSAADNLYNEIATDTTLDSNLSQEFNYYGRMLLNIRLTMANESRSLLELNENEIGTLEDVATNALYWAKVRAENWLNLYDSRSISDIQGHPQFDENLLPKLVQIQKASTNLYPNPVQENLELEYVNLNDEGSILEIINTVGNLILKTDLEGSFGHKSISLKFLNTGLYFYNIRYRDYIFEKGKIVKE